MLEDLAELLEATASEDLREHRHPNVQVKQSWKQDAGKQLCGRANDLRSPSSWMVIGVSDDGQLIGRDENWVKQQEQLISLHLNQYLDPPQACTHFRCHRVKSSWLVVIGVSNPGAVVRWDDVPYKSIGTTCQPMEPEEALEFALQLPGLQDLSVQPWDGQVNAGAVQDFARRVGERDGGGALANLHQLPTDTILQRLHLGGTVASRILFGDIRCRIVVYDVADAVLQNKSAAVYDVLSRGFQDSLSSTLRRSPTTPIWPPLALSEGIANAVAHAAYFERDGELMLELHPGWLCISNLCDRAATAFANKWFSRSHRTLNTFLMESLRLAGFVDELGRGKNLILRDFLFAGMRPPSVAVESAGRLSRWRLLLPTHSGEEKHVQLLRRLREHYPNDDKKALLAMALALWRGKPYSEIEGYVSEENHALLDEILNDRQAPVFRVPEEDKLYLYRWAQLILDEGLDSKQLSPGEEQRLLDFAYRMATRFDASIITPAVLRRWGQMGHSPSEKSLSSRILKKWETDHLIERVGKGKYKFLPRPSPPPDASQTPL